MCLTDLARSLTGATNDPWLDMTHKKSDEFWLEWLARIYRDGLSFFLTRIGSWRQLIWTRVWRQLSPFFFFWSRLGEQRNISRGGDWRNVFHCFVMDAQTSGEETINVSWWTHFCDVTLACLEEPLPIETSSCVFLCHSVSGGCFCDLCAHVLDRWHVCEFLSSVPCPISLCSSFLIGEVSHARSTIFDCSIFWLMWRRTGSSLAFALCDMIRQFEPEQLALCRAFTKWETVNVVQQFLDDVRIVFPFSLVHQLRKRILCLLTWNISHPDWEFLQSRSYPTIIRNVQFSEYIEKNLSLTSGMCNPYVWFMYPCLTEMIARFLRQCPRSPLSFYVSQSRTVNVTFLRTP